VITQVPAAAARVAIADGTSVRLGGSRVTFGALEDALSGLRFDQPVGLVTSPSQVANGTVERIERVVRCDLGILDCRAHATAEEIVAASIALRSARTVIAVGGGATIGVAKAVAAGTAAHLVAVPTTYSGSEMTGLYGITRQGRKTVVANPAVLPRVVVYDPSTTWSLPDQVTIASLMNCLAHGIEAAWAGPPPVPGPALAVELAGWMAEGLTRLHNDPGRRDGRAELQAAAWLGGLCLSTGGTALHHAICQTLGGMLRTSHGLLNAAVLPAVMRFNSPATAELQARIVEPLRPVAGDAGDDPPWEVVARLVADWEAAVRLGDLGLEVEDCDRAAELVMSGRGPQRNPRPVTHDEVAALIRELI